MLGLSVGRDEDGPSEPVSSAPRVSTTAVPPTKAAATTTETTAAFTDRGRSGGGGGWATIAQGCTPGNIQARRFTSRYGAEVGGAKAQVAKMSRDIFLPMF